MENRKVKNLFCVIVAVILFCTVLAAACDASDGASQTNNQTAGVDESDIVKVTSDGYIFKAQSDGLTVSKANDGDVEVIIREGYRDFTPREMFVTDDFLILLGDKRTTLPGTYNNITKSRVAIYDINELKNDNSDYLVRSCEFYGNFYTARLFNNQIYILFRLSYYEYGSVPNLNYFDDTYQGEKRFDVVRDLLSENETMSYHGFIMAKFDLSAAATAAVTAKFYCGQYISDLYCSPYAIYAISSYWSRFGICGVSGQGQTKITKISLVNLSVKNQLSFDGSVLNRYSLYDNGSVFYMAATYRGVNAVYAFDNDFGFLGKSQNFAAGESIYSVTYEENLCYVVTFRQIDPLFKIDISNPLDITILGELKIEGYSTHLQSFGDYLIGLGFDTNAWAQTQGLKLTLFGVEDNAPVEINSIYFSDYGQNSQTEASYNPKAILCEPENNIFAFPIQYMYQGKYVQGAVIFGVVDGELEERAFLTNHTTNNYTLDVAKNIMRITRIGNYLYTIADGYIASYSLADFSLIGIFDTRLPQSNPFDGY